MSQCKYFLLLSLMTTFSISGCGNANTEGRPQPVAVSGTLTANGQPVANARLVFSPIGHEWAGSAITDNSGFFQARTFTDDDGLVPGKFQILASSFTVVENPNGTVTETHFFPEKYRKPDSSELQTEITAEGTDKLLLNLTFSQSDVNPPKVVPE